MAPSEFRSVSVQRLEVGVMGQERQYAPEKTADATEALAELGALLRAIRDKLEGSAKVLVLLGKPLKQWLGLDRILHLEPGRLVHELAAVELGLLGRGVDVISKSTPEGWVFGSQRNAPLAALRRT
jgi:hypothetical protein